MQDFTPARRWAVWGLLAAGLVAIGVFCLILRASTRAARPLDPADYTVCTAPPDNFSWQCAVQKTPGAVALTGWAAFTDAPLSTIDCRAVLCQPETGICHVLPTTLQSSAAAADTLGGTRFAGAGFYAFALTKGALAAPDGFELCFAYRNDGDNRLIHTGVTLQELGGAA